MLDGCSDKEKKYLETWKGKSAEEVTKQIERLDGMAGKKMKSDAK
eukprot:gene2239-8328_t